MSLLVIAIVVTLTTLETRAGIMGRENAAKLTGAGALSVLVFPLAAAALGRRQ